MNISNPINNNVALPGKFSGDDTMVKAMSTPSYESNI